jgi:hypothetical protein
VLHEGHALPARYLALVREGIEPADGVEVIIQIDTGTCKKLWVSEGARNKIDDLEAIGHLRTMRSATG